MHLTISPLLLTLTLALSTPTLAERPYFCPLSLDVHMMQYPFCCEGFVPARDSQVSMEGVNCVDVSKNEDFTWNCSKGGSPKCCYTIGASVICTTEVADGTIV